LAWRNRAGAFEMLRPEQFAAPASLSAVATIVAAIVVVMATALLDNAKNSPMRSMVPFAPAGQTKYLEISG
jgi:hypothetical protein